MILVLHARLPTLWVVIVRHVEPGAERKKQGGLEMEKGSTEHTQSNYYLLNGLVGARRINVTGFTFSNL